MYFMSDLKDHYIFDITQKLSIRSHDIPDTERNVIQYTGSRSCVCEDNFCRRRVSDNV